MCAAALAGGPAAASEMKDAQYGYSVSPPEFPASEAAAFPRLTVFAPPDADTKFSANMGLMVQETATTRDQFIAQSRAQFEQAGAKVRSTSNRTVSGRPAVVIDYEGNLTGRPLRFLALAVILPERVLLLTYTAPAATYGQHEKEFKRSLETFKLDR
jgi:hypothetical protein